MIKTNEDKLVMMSVQGTVSHHIAVFNLSPVLLKKWKIKENKDANISQMLKIGIWRPKKKTRNKK